MSIWDNYDFEGVLTETPAEVERQPVESQTDIQQALQETGVPELPWSLDFLDRTTASVQESFGTVLGGIGALSDALGMEKARDWSLSRSKELFEEAASHDLVKTEFSKIDDPVDALKWGAETLTTLFPDLVMAAMGGAGVATAAVKAASHAPMKSLIRGAAKSSLKRNYDDLLKQYGKKEALEKAYRKTAGEIGGMAGMSAYEGFQGFGGSYLTDVELRGEDEASVAAAAASGLSQAAVSFVSPLNKFLTKMGRGKTDILKMTLGEGLEEMTQEGISLAHKAGVDESKTIGEYISDPEEFTKLLESGVAGALMGGAISTPKIISDRRKAKAEDLVSRDKEAVEEAANEALKGVGVDPESGEMLYDPEYQEPKVPKRSEVIPKVSKEAEALPTRAGEAPKVEGVSRLEEKTKEFEQEQLKYLQQKNQVRTLESQLTPEQLPQLQQLKERIAARDKVTEDNRKLNEEIDRQLKEYQEPKVPKRSEVIPKVSKEAEALKKPTDISGKVEGQKKTQEVEQKRHEKALKESSEYVQEKLRYVKQKNTKRTLADAFATPEGEKILKMVQARDKQKALQELEKAKDIVVDIEKAQEIDRLMSEVEEDTNSIPTASVSQKNTLRKRIDSNVQKVTKVVQEATTPAEPIVTKAEKAPSKPVEAQAPRVKRRVKVRKKVQQEAKREAPVQAIDYEDTAASTVTGTKGWAELATKSPENLSRVKEGESIVDAIADQEIKDPIVEAFASEDVKKLKDAISHIRKERQKGFQVIQEVRDVKEGQKGLRTEAHMIFDDMVEHARPYLKKLGLDHTIFEGAPELRKQVYTETKRKPGRISWSKADSGITTGKLGDSTPFTILEQETEWVAYDTRVEDWKEIARGKELKDVQAKVEKFTPKETQKSEARKTDRGVEYGEYLVYKTGSPSSKRTRIAYAADPEQKDIFNKVFQSQKKALDFLKELEKEGQVHEAMVEEGLVKGEGETKVVSLGTLFTNVANYEGADPTIKSFIKGFLKSIPEDKLKGIPVVYDPSMKGPKYEGGVVYLTQDKREDHAIHEGIHAVTVREMATNPKLFKEVVTLKDTFKQELLNQGLVTKKDIELVESFKGSSQKFNKAKEDGKIPRENASILYALLNEQEFLSQSFHIKEMQDVLKGIRLDKPQGRLQTLWDAFVDFVRRVLGRPIVHTNALDKVLTLTEELAQVDVTGVKNGRAFHAPTDTAFTKDVPTTEAEVVSRAAKATKEGRKDRIVANLKEMPKKYVQTVGDRIRKIDERIMDKLTRMEFQISEDEAKYKKQIDKFVSGYRKLDSRDKAIVKYSLLNNDSKARAMREQYNDRLDLENIYQTLDEINKRAEGAGIAEYKRIKGYFPRVVSNVDGLKKMLHKDQNFNDILHEVERLKEAAIKKGKEFTDADADAVVTSILNTGTIPDTLKRPGSSLKRSVWFVPPEAMQFYSDPIEALSSHIYENVEAVAQRKLIGKSNRLQILKDITKLSEQYNESDSKAKQEEIRGKIIELDSQLRNVEAEIEDSIASHLLKDSKLEVDQMREVVDLVRSRLIQGAMNKNLARIRNIGLMTAIGNPFSAITQLGDIAWSLYDNGVPETMEALFGKRRLKAKDFNLQRVLREFSQSETAQWVDFTLRRSGLQFMDNFGKTTSMNAALSKARKQSEGQFVKQWESALGKEVAQRTHKDIISENMSDDVRYFVFQRLAKWQPITLSEFPQAYLDSPNGRIFYTLKSYNIKALNNIYRETISKIKKPETRARGLYEFGKLLTILTLANASVDELKNFILGKEEPFSEIVQDNLLNLAFSSRYSMDRGMKGGFLSVAFADLLSLPAVRLVDEPIKDLRSLAKGEPEFSTLKVIPIFGKLAYEKDWFTDTAAKRNLRKKREGVVKRIKEDTLGISSFNTSKAIREYNKEAEKLGISPIKWKTVRNIKRNARRKANEN